MKQIALFIIRVYQKTLSPDHGIVSRGATYRGCRYYPSCSEYMYESIKRYGTFKGIKKGIGRILRCNPWSLGGYDPPFKKDSEDSHYVELA